MCVCVRTHKNKPERKKNSIVEGHTKREREKIRQREPQTNADLKKRGESLTKTRDK